MHDETHPTQTRAAQDDRDDEAAEIRYSLTALGEALVAERKRARFRGFGPCAVATLPTAG